MTPDTAKVQIVAEPSAWPALVMLDRLPEMLMSTGSELIATTEILREGLPCGDANQAAVGKVNELCRQHCLHLETLQAPEVAIVFELTVCVAQERLSDGEAAAIALALHRGLECLSEDRKVRRIFSGRFARRIMTVRQLIESAAAAEALGPADVLMSLRGAADCANPYGVH